MGIYVCRIKKARIADFKAQWSVPQDIGSWNENIEASNEAEACELAFRQLCPPIGHRHRDLANQSTEVRSLEVDWFECFVDNGN